MEPYLLLRLEAPLMSFGRTAVDHRRPVQAWPAVSMLTGLLANALGWDRSQADQLDRLQSRLRWAARIDRPGFSLSDFQTAQLGRDDQGWTTRGVVEHRDGGPDAYRSPHLRLRDYRADASVLVALGLEPAQETPTLGQLADALDAPMRPLFIGRKGCPPATRIAAGMVEAGDALQALLLAPGAAGETPAAAADIYFGEGVCSGVGDAIVHDTSDERRFGLDLHGGRQRVYQRPTRRA